MRGNGSGLGIVVVLKKVIVVTGDCLGFRQLFTLYDRVVRRDLSRKLRRAEDHALFCRRQHKQVDEIFDRTTGSTEHHCHGIGQHLIAVQVEHDPVCTHRDRNVSVLRGYDTIPSITAFKNGARHRRKCILARIFCIEELIEQRLHGGVPIDRVRVRNVELQVGHCDVDRAELRTHCNRIPVTVCRHEEGNRDPGRCIDLVFAEVAFIQFHAGREAALQDRATFAGIEPVRAFDPIVRRNDGDVCIEHHSAADGDGNALDTRCLATVFHDGVCILHGSRCGIERAGGGYGVVGDVFARTGSHAAFVILKAVSTARRDAACRQVERHDHEGLAVDGIDGERIVCCVVRAVDEACRSAVRRDTEGVVVPAEPVGAARIGVQVEALGGAGDHVIREDEGRVRAADDDLRPLVDRNAAAGAVEFGRRHRNGVDERAVLIAHFDDVGLRSRHEGRKGDGERAVRVADERNAVCRLPGGELAAVDVEVNSRCGDVALISDDYVAARGERCIVRDGGSDFIGSDRRQIEPHAHSLQRVGTAEGKVKFDRRQVVVAGDDHIDRRARFVKRRPGIICTVYRDHADGIGRGDGFGEVDGERDILIVIAMLCGGNAERVLLRGGIGRVEIGRIAGESKFRIAVHHAVIQRRERGVRERCIADGNGCARRAEFIRQSVVDDAAADEVDRHTGFVVAEVDVELTEQNGDISRGLHGDGEFEVRRGSRIVDGVIRIFVQLPGDGNGARLIGDIHAGIAAAKLVIAAARDGAAHDRHVAFFGDLVPVGVELAERRAQGGIVLLAVERMGDVGRHIRIGVGNAVRIADEAVRTDPPAAAVLVGDLHGETVVDHGRRARIAAAVLLFDLQVLPVLQIEDGCAVVEIFSLGSAAAVDALTIHKTMVAAVGKQVCPEHDFIAHDIFVAVQARFHAASVDEGMQGDVGVGNGGLLRKRGALRCNGDLVAGHALGGGADLEVVFRSVGGNAVSRCVDNAGEEEARIVVAVVVRGAEHAVAEVDDLCKRVIRKHRRAVRIAEAEVDDRGRDLTCGAAVHVEVERGGDVLRRQVMVGARDIVVNVRALRRDKCGVAVVQFDKEAVRSACRRQTVVDVGRHGRSRSALGKIQRPVAVTVDAVDGGDLKGERDRPEPARRIILLRRAVLVGDAQRRIIGAQIAGLFKVGDRRRSAGREADLGAVVHIVGENELHRHVRARVERNGGKIALSALGDAGDIHRPQRRHHAGDVDDDGRILRAGERGGRLCAADAADADDHVDIRCGIGHDDDGRAALRRRSGPEVAAPDAQRHIARAARKIACKFFGDAGSGARERDSHLCGLPGHIAAETDVA